MSLKKRKGTKILSTNKTFIKMHIVQQTENQLRRNTNRHANMWITTKWVGPVNDEKWMESEKYNKKLKSLKNNWKDIIS